MPASELVSLVQAQRRLGRLPRRSAAQPAVEDALSRQEAARRVARRANPGGRWGPPALADESTQVLRDAGATLVAATLAETRTYLGGLAGMPRLPVPETREVALRSSGWP